MTAHDLATIYAILRAQYGARDPRTRCAWAALVWSEAYGVADAARGWLRTVLAKRGAG